MNSKAGRRRRWGVPSAAAFLALCVAARLALGLAHSLITPPWESYDEQGHFEYARYIAKYGRLLQPGDPEADAIWSKFQPPLYYLIVAPALRGFDLGDRFQAPILNPFLVNGDAGVNYAATPDRPQGLEQQTIRALRAGRAASGLISAASLIFVYMTARRLWPRQRRLAQTATVLYAFWPQFMFIGNMMTNDLLVTSLAAVALYLIVSLLQDGVRPGPLAALGLVMLAAMLTKLNGLALIPAALVALLAPAADPPRGRRLALIGLLAGAVLIGLFLLGSLDFVTGHVFQFSTVQRLVNNLLAQALSPQQAAAALRVAAYGLWTFFASYGWGNLETFGWLYWLWLAGMAAAGIGLARRRRPEDAGLPGAVGLAVGLTAAGVVGLSGLLSIAQNDPFLVVGRYWLPALPGLTLVLAVGWRRLAPARDRALQAGALFMILVSWLAPFAVIAPAYAKPRPMDAAQAAQLQTSAAAVFGGDLRLLGFLPIAPAHPDSAARLTLCWEARAPLTENYPLLLEVVGPDGQGYGRLMTYPGRGNYPTRLWEPGRPFCDDYAVPIRGDFPAPALGEVRLQFQTEPFGPALPVTGPDGSQRGADARLPLVVRSTTRAPEPAHPLPYRFGDEVRLRGIDVAALTDGRTGWRVTLHWEARAPVGEEYKVFVHLRDTPQTAYAQSDQTPRRNTYPTRYWTPGETVLDEHDLVLPPGPTPTLELYIGLYRPQDGARLPVFGAEGQALPNAEVRLPFPITD